MNRRNKTTTFHQRYGTTDKNKLNNIILKVKKGGKLMSDESREMALKEWVERLHKHHRAYKEYIELLEALKEIKKLADISIGAFPEPDKMSIYSERIKHKAQYAITKAEGTGEAKK